MDKQRKQRIVRIVSLVTGLIFLMGALDFIDRGRPLFGVLQIVAGLLNLLSALPPEKLPRWQGTLKYGVLGLNVLVAISVAIDYFQAGKQYIQYAWVLIAIISTVALVIQWRKDGVGERGVED